MRCRTGCWSLISPSWSKGPVTYAATYSGTLRSTSGPGANGFRRRRRGSPIQGRTRAGGVAATGRGGPSTISGVCLSRGAACLAGARPYRPAAGGWGHGDRQPGHGDRQPGHEAFDVKAAEGGRAGHAPAGEPEEPGRAGIPIRQPREVRSHISRDAQGVAHYDSRSDRAFTSSLSCRTISVVLRISASPRATPMVEAITRKRAFISR
jgi:hypothetical protein